MALAQSSTTTTPHLAAKSPSKQRKLSPNLSVGGGDKRRSLLANISELDREAQVPSL